MSRTDQHETDFEAFDLTDYGYADAEEAFADLYNEGFYADYELARSGASTQAQESVYRHLLAHLPEEDAQALKNKREYDSWLDREIGADPTPGFLEDLAAWAPLAEYPDLEYGDVVEEEYIPPEGLLTGTYHVGAAFEGVNGIDEYEDDQFYVPTSSFCLLRVLDRFFELTGSPTRMPRKGAKSEITPESMRTLVKGVGVDLKSIPRLLKPVEHDGVWGFEKLSTREPTGVLDYAIALMPVVLEGGEKHTGYYHAVLVKNPPKNANGSMAVGQISFEAIGERMKSTKRTLMDTDPGSSYTKPASPPKPWMNVVYAYDYETSSADNFRQDIEGVSVMRVPLVGEGSRITAQTPTAKFYGATATDEMLQWVREDAASQDPPLREVQLFAHNGGRFDTLLAMGQATSVEWKKQLSAGGCIKQAEGVYKEDRELKIKMKDSCCFTLMSLADIGKAFKCEVQKRPGVQIGNRSHEWFEANGDAGECWKQYMDQDVQALGCVLVTVEGHLRALSQSITTTCGISAVAWNLVCHNAAPEFSKVEIPRCPVTQAFHSQASYGGRVIHWRKYFKAGETKFNCPRLGKYTSKGIICFDANSLYPFVMSEFDFPYGKATIVQGGTAESRMASLEEAKKADQLYIAEVTLDAGNQRFPLTPHRTKEGRVTYPAGVFSGVYTSVDIDEALSQGYKLVAVERLTVWKKKCNMFRRVIEYLYTRRLEFKRAGNSFEYVIKIVLNSMYGKFRETVRNSVTFAKNPSTRGRKLQSQLALPNGQTRRQFRILNARSKKPTHIAAFILSYSKLHMNRLIRKLGPENILYGDTDAIIATIESGADIREGEPLGSFKNDNGEGVLFREAWFLDLKRYFAIYNQPKMEKGVLKEYVAKFNGLSFKRGNVLADFCYENGVRSDSSRLEQMTELYKTLAVSPEISAKCAVDRWKRVGFEVFVSPDKRASFSVNPSSRAQWRKGNYYPLGFDFTKPALPIFAEEATEPSRTAPKNYLWQGSRFHMPHPLAMKGGFRSMDGKDGPNKEGRLAAACASAGFARAGQQVVMRLGPHWHKYTPLGPGQRVCAAEDDELFHALPGALPVLTVPPESSPLSPVLTKEEYETFRRALGKMIEAQSPGLLERREKAPLTVMLTLDDVYE